MPRQCKARRKYRPPYDWEKIQADWLTSPHKRIIEFAKDRGIPYCTARRNLKLKEKDGLAAEALRAAVLQPAGPSDVLENTTNGAEVIERRRVYVSALTDGAKRIEKLVRSAEAEYEAMTTGDSPLRWRTPAEPAGIILRATEQHQALAAELQGIPSDRDESAWEITRKFWPLRYQRDFIFDTPSSLKAEGREGFIIAFIAGVGSGKTFCGAQKAGEIAWRNRGLPFGIFAPTYRMLEDPSCAKHRFLDVIADKGLSFRYHASKNSITIFGDTEVLFRSMDDPEHLRGTELGAAWIDEGLQMPARAAFDVIMARIRGRKGDANTLEAKEPCLLFTGTPNGMNWGYDILVEEAETNHVMLYHGRTVENVMLDPSYYTRLSHLYDEKMAKQELGGEFIDIYRGQVYFAFLRQYHVIATSMMKLLDPRLPLDLCVDFNVSPLCWNVCQDYVYNGDRVTYCLDEIHLDDANTSTAIEEFLRRYGAHKGGVRIYGDATGRARHTSASRTDYEVIVQALEEKKVPNVSIRVGRSNPLVTDRANSMNGRLRNAAGEIRFYVLAHCKETVKDFEKTGYIPGTRQIDKTTTRSGGAIVGHSHHTDAVSYKIDRDFPVRKMHVHQGRPEEQHNGE